MKCAVIDTTKGRGQSLALELKTLGHEVYEFDGKAWAPSIPVTAEVALFHAGDSGLWRFVQGVGGLKERILWFSGAGVSDGSIMEPPGVGIPRKIDAAGDASPAEWRELLDFMAQGLVATADRPLPRLLQADSPSVLIALSILCQGYLLARAPASQVPRRKELGIGVLNRQGWWAQPFAPIGGKIGERVRLEWGSASGADAVLSLAKWIEKGLDVESLEKLDLMVRDAKAALDEHFRGGEGRESAGSPT